MTIVKENSVDNIKSRFGFFSRKVEIKIKFNEDYSLCLSLIMLILLLS